MTHAPMARIGQMVPAWGLCPWGRSGLGSGRPAWPVPDFVSRMPSWDMDVTLRQVGNSITSYAGEDWRDVTWARAGATRMSRLLNVAHKRIEQLVALCGRTPGTAE